MLTAVCGFLFDTVVGDPRSKFHPVVLIGRLISMMESALYHEGDRDRRKLMAGGLLAITVLLVVYQVAAGIDGLLSQLDNKLVTILVEGFLFSFTISPRSLAEAGREIYNYLENDDLENARYKVGWIVGRDTEKLSPGEVTRATVETVAENTVDGIIAPFFFAIYYASDNSAVKLTGTRNATVLSISATPAAIYIHADALRHL